MFDLFRSRDKAVRILLTAILSLVTLSMVGYLIPNYGGGSDSSPNDTVVADVGKTKVTVHDVQIAVRNITRNREMPPGMLEHYVPQMIEQLITEKALVLEAERIGIKVSEAETAKVIRDQMPQLFTNGQFVGKEAYAAVLAQQDSTIPEFEEAMRQQILLNRLRNIALESTVVSKTDVEHEFRLKNEKAAIAYVKIDPEKIKAGLKISPEEFKSYYDKTKAAYQVPEKRALRLVVVDPAKINADIKVSDEQLRRAYEQNKDRYRVPERVKARHILLMTQGKSKEDEAKAKAKAEDLLKQVKGGADFGEVAKKNSEDPGSKDKGGDLDWVVRGQTVPEFEKALFDLKPKEISGIVKTTYGYHIIQALDKEQAHLKTLDEVKTELLAELRNQAGQNAVQSTVDNAEAALRKDPRQVDQIASQYKLIVVDAPKVGVGDPVPEVGVNRDFTDAVFSLKKGEVSQPVSVPGNRMVIAVVADVYPAHPASMEEAEPQVRAALIQDQTNKRVGQQADELLKKVKAENGELEKVAKSMGLTVVTTPPFNRTGQIEGLGSPDAIPEIFTKPVGTVFGPTFIGAFRVVGKITARIDPNMADLAAQEGVIRDDIKHTKARERDALFEDGVREALIKEGKIKVHPEVLKRVVSSFHG